MHHKYLRLTPLLFEDIQKSNWDIFFDLTVENFLERFEIEKIC